MKLCFRVKNECHCHVGAGTIVGLDTIKEVGKLMTSELLDWGLLDKADVAK